MNPSKFYLGIAVLALLCAGLWSFVYFANQDQGGNPLEPEPEAIRKADEVIAERKKLDRTVWSQEVEAQKYEACIVKLWDDLRRSEDKATVLTSFPFETLALGKPGTWTTIQAGIRQAKLAPPQRQWSQGEFKQLVARLADDGLRLVQSEWHHAEFKAEPRPGSVVSFALHLENKTESQRFIVKGKLRIDWSGRSDKDKLPQPEKIAVTEATILEGIRSQRFEKISNLKIEADGFTAFYDLNRDGLLDIVHSANSVLWNRAGGGFERSEISPHQEWQLTCGALADFNGDGLVDFVCGGRNETLKIFLASSPATAGKPLFDKPALEIAVTEPLDNPSALAVGDVDQDGDLDIWVAQYKYPYVKGQMPTPYFNANDGYPSHLLLNDGTGQFIDATKGSGLERKRFRRTYSCSFVDLNNDGKLDLLVNSDFSGIDLYRNQGKGKFVDATNEMVEEWHNFGMSHSFSDYNLDGRLDFFITGMSSTTARRLDAMKLGRQEFTEHQEMRSVMGYGNRMYLGGGDRYSEPIFKNSVARTGWSWGSTSADFDNDGDADMYVANGHVSGKTAQDYCTKFWCHDIYTGTSKSDKAMDIVFKTDSSLGGMSWNGFEHNCLLLNLQGKDFVEVGFLLGVAFEFDSRAVIGGDLDGDGRVDLYVGQNRGDGRQAGHVLRNIGPILPDHHWIGVRLYEHGNGVTPIGAKIQLQTNRGPRVAQVVTGDSLNAQHGNIVHFGLGPKTQVTRLEVLWPNGLQTRIDNPALDSYHLAKPPSR